MRGCQSIDTVNSLAATGSSKAYIPLRRLSVWRSGTVAIRSDSRARANAAEKPPTIVATRRCMPIGKKRTVDRAIFGAGSGNHYMLSVFVPLRRDRTAGKWVSRPHHADKTISEQSLASNFRTERLFNYARL
jgi:hypothetical protein